MYEDRMTHAKSDIKYFEGKLKAHSAEVDAARMNYEKVKAGYEVRSKFLLYTGVQTFWVGV